MAPLVPPPPAITLEEAKSIESKLIAKPLPTREIGFFAWLLGAKPASNSHAFTGRAFVQWALEQKLATDAEHAAKIGQALLEHRLAHHVTDDFEFLDSAEHEYVLIAQESAEVRALHAALGEIIAKPEEFHQGKLELRSKTFWGFERWTSCYGVLDVSSTPKQLVLYKRFSAASAPILSLAVEGCQCHLTECLDCKSDWYCFNLRALKDGKMQQFTLCADHSKRQEGWLQALSSVGVEFEKEEMGSDLSKVQSIFELKSRRLNSNEVVSLDQYKGKVCLVVNVSSKCGLTPRDYPQLTTLYEKYKDQGFEILAFPSNDFANQEPGTEAEIQEFVKQYNVTFPIFGKIHVNGSNADPVFRFLKGKLGGVLGSSIKWNFTKFLCDRNGIPITRYGPPTTPLTFEQDIVAMLKSKGEVVSEYHSVQ